jgi:hypothetical protein
MQTIIFCQFSTRKSSRMFFSQRLHTPLQCFPCVQSVKHFVTLGTCALQIAIYIFIPKPLIRKVVCAFHPFRAAFLANPFAATPDFPALGTPPRRPQIFVIFIFRHEIYMQITYIYCIQMRNTVIYTVGGNA